MPDKSIRCRILGGEKKIMTPPRKKNQRRTPENYNYKYHMIYYMLCVIPHIYMYIYTYIYIHIFYIILYMGMQGVDYFPQPGTSLKLVIFRSRFDGKSQVTRGYFAMFPGKLIYP